ncbi:NADH-quinone oxidoreductase subunit NuoE family protein, partial [Cloacibacillus porcorum]|uniref:NADH-quinone oxidoreductase subunit NuoE family protein n=1 Tax=Cloacibacillus porcorum TaxID=1197717 RepID=UPI003F11D626
YYNPGALFGCTIFGMLFKDGRFTLEIARCIGSCGLAPALMIDDVIYKQMTPNKVDAVLSRL